MPAELTTAQSTELAFAEISTGLDLFPEDQYEAYPELQDGAKDRIAAQETEIVALVALLRWSDRFSRDGMEKPFWFTVIRVGGPGGPIHKANFGTQVDRYLEDGTPVLPRWDRWQRVAFALGHGAKSVRGLTIEAVDTNKGNPFYKVRALLPRTEVTEEKRKRTA